MANFRKKVYEFRKVTKIIIHYRRASFSKLKANANFFVLWGFPVFTVFSWFYVSFAFSPIPEVYSQSGHFSGQTPPLLFPPRVVLCLYFYFFLRENCEGPTDLFFRCSHGSFIGSFLSPLLTEKNSFLLRETVLPRGGGRISCSL